MSNSIDKAKNQDDIPMWLGALFVFAISSMIWAFIQIVIVVASFISGMNEKVATTNLCEDDPCRKYVHVTIADQPNIITSMQSVVRGTIKEPIDHFPANKLVIFDCKSSECGELKPHDEGVFDCTLIDNGSKITSCTLHDVNLPVSN